MHYDLHTGFFHFGERRLPWVVARLECAWDPQRRFGHETRQLIFRFENRWGLSVIWGSGTYSDNRDWWGDYSLRKWHDNVEMHEEPLAVEVGVFVPDTAEGEGGLWGDPFGWCAAWELATIVDVIGAMPSRAYPERPDEVYSVDELSAWWELHRIEFEEAR